MDSDGLRSGGVFGWIFACDSSRVLACDLVGFSASLVRWFDLKDPVVSLLSRDFLDSTFVGCPRCRDSSGSPAFLVPGNLQWMI